MGDGVFVVGTDTGVGKTVVTAGLLHCLRQSGLDAVPMKPIQTGGALRDDQLFSSDLDFCLKTIGYQPSAEELQLMNPYCFQPACSPHLAAEMAGVQIDIGKIEESLRQLLAGHQAVVVEGAGGLLVPIDRWTTTMDLILALALPVVVVARKGLGTINHSLLTLNELRRQNVEVFGVILNEATPDNCDLILKSNVHTIENMGFVSVLGTLDHLPMSSEDELRQEVVSSFSQMVPGWNAVLDRLRSTS